MVSERCPLCHGVDVGSYFEDKRREYLRCSRCFLVFVPARFQLAQGAEKHEYDLHQNELGDAGYLGFLQRLGKPLVDRLTPAARGLDFGCGPGPALQLWLQEQGFEVCIYDKFYASDVSVFDCKFDFITATEVVEHLRQPGLTLNALWAQLYPGGVLALMTKRVIDVQAFSRWHYKNDPTHISFFADQSFRWLAKEWDAKLEFEGSDVVFLCKPL